MNNKRLYLSRDKIIGGVAGGIGEFFGIDSTIVRLLFVLALFGGGAGILLYLAAWFVIPEPKHDQGNFGSIPQDDSTVQGFKEAAQSFAKASGELANDAKQSVQSTIHRNTDRENSNNLLGIILIVIGGIFLVRLLMPSFRWELFFPILLVLAGVGLLLKSMRR